VATGYNQMFFDQSYSKFNASAVNTSSPEQIHGPAYTATPADFSLANYVYSPIKPEPNMFGGFVIGNRFFNNKLGVLVSANYQNTFSGTQSIFLTPSAQPNYVPANQPVFDDIQARTYFIQQTREAFHAKLDYDFDKNNKISYYTVYVNLDELRHRHISDTVANINVGEVDQHDETKVTHQSIYNSTFEI